MVVGTVFRVILLKSRLYYDKINLIRNKGKRRVVCAVRVAFVLTLGAEHMEHILKEKLEDCPVVAAVRDEKGLDQALDSECGVIFILFGDLLNIEEVIRRVKEAGKLAMVHMDLIGGLGAKDVSVDFIRQNTKADGIITTKPQLIKHAKEVGLLTILRLFLLDSMAYENIGRQCAACHPDCIEVLPGVLPKVIRRICKQERTPVIAGGLMADKEDIMTALQAGAISVSATNPELWFL